MQKPHLAKLRSGARGANDRTRTGDLSLTRGLLYQLSYVGFGEISNVFLAEEC